MRACGESARPYEWPSRTASKTRCRASSPRPWSCGAGTIHSFPSDGPKSWSAGCRGASCGFFPASDTRSTTAPPESLWPPCARSSTCERLMAEQVDYVADFDSATGMLRALAASLRGEGLPLLGAMRRSRAPLMKLVASVVNHLPTALQEQVYILSGWMEAMSPRKLGTVSGEAVAAWMTDLYPRRQYPAVVVGSSNGAAVHLWAALGIPWLPQTFLVPVARSGIPPDEPREEMRWAAPHAETVLRRNPDLELHHMHDPVQDRLMVQRMSYFRFKRRTLGAAYEDFLRECLEPGGTIIVMECGLPWPTTRRGDRYVFQFGALGGSTPVEMMRGGERVEAYLRRHRSSRLRWDPPPADGTSPEAEWGFAPSLREDVAAFARRHGYRVRRVVFDQPEDMSPLVADLYRWWYERLGIADNHLVFF